MNTQTDNSKPITGSQIPSEKTLSVWICGTRVELPHYPTIRNPTESDIESLGI